MSKSFEEQILEEEVAEELYFPLCERKQGRLFVKLADFVFPQHLVCHCCNREAIVNEYGVCEQCLDKLIEPPFHSKIDYVDDNRSALAYNETAGKVIRNMKYNGKLYVKELLAHFMRIPIKWQFDYVIPVPMHKTRYRKRGYNQSKVLANQLCKRYNLTLRDDLLARIKDTPQQARLDAQQRQRNLKHAFKASNECAGKSFLLVDDVKTTGSTLKECAHTLKKAGAVRIYAITACCVIQD